MSVEDYTPSVDEIGKRLYARTLTTTGRREGTFSDQTTPTATAVRELIEDAVQTVNAAVGEELDNMYWPMAKTAVIAYTCMSIEASYYPESTDAADSAYKAFRDRFAQQVGYINDALNQKRPNERRILSIPMGTMTGPAGGGRLDPWSNDLLP